MATSRIRFRQLELLGITITSVSSPYIVPVMIDTVLCDASGGAITVNLPSAVTDTWRLLLIKKVDSSANVVTVDGNAAETIDGELTQLLKRQWASLQLQSDGLNWLIV